MNQILTLTTEQIRSFYTTGDLTPLQVLGATVDQISAVNPLINAITDLNIEEATAAAQASGTRWKAGQPLSVLDGIPVSIKDSVAAQGLPRRHGTAPNASLPVSDFDAPPAARLKEAGALIFGKTAMPDFGMLASGVSSLYGITRNPWNLARTPGGSSAGAGASLAAGIGWGSVGSDIAGSVRLPAGHCGLVALKPTQGRIPHLAPSTVRSAGPMARSVKEAAELYSIISRPDSRDNLSLPEEDKFSAGDRSINPEGLSVGILNDMGYGFEPAPEVQETVNRAGRLLAEAGASVSTVAPPFQTDPYPWLDILFQIRARAEWESFDEAGRRAVLPEITDWCAPAARYTATDYERALGNVHTSQARLARQLDAYDIVLSPVVPVVSFGAEQVGLDPSRPLAHCSFTCWYNQTGQPAASVCFGMSGGHPIGLQIIGKRFMDQQVLQLTQWFESRRGFEPAWPTTPRNAELTAAATFGV
jgi:amidase